MEIITHEDALKGADPWQRVRLHLRAHEIIVLAEEQVNGAAVFNSRNRLLAAIGEYARSRE